MKRQFLVKFMRKRTRIQSQPLSQCLNYTSSRKQCSRKTRETAQKRISPCFYGEKTELQ